MPRWLERGLARLRPDLPPPAGRGYVDHVVPGDGSVLVGGWLFAPGRSLDGFRLRFDGRTVTEDPPIRREDVALAFPDWAEATTSGFAFRPAVTEAALRRGFLLVVEGLDRGEVTARIRLRYRAGFHDGFPDPPAPLRRRVVNSEELRTYWLGGLQTHDEMARRIERWWGRTPRRLLDWGCGCGRVTSFFLRDLPRTEVHGCDIDGEAIAWCRASLGERFAVIDPFPPTPYADGSFDVVVGYSVLTHLRRELQTAWMAEVRRLLAPGGLLLATLHGEFVMAFARNPQVDEEVAATGVSDCQADANLDGIAPAGYYRGTYQSRAYTTGELARGFEVLEYVPQAITNFQDLVVLRRV